jgi:cytochrome b561
VKISDNFGAHFFTAHHQLGIIVIGLSVIQPIVGLIAHLQYDPQRESVPIIDRVHQFLGYITLILAVVSLFLGLDIYGAPSRLYVIVGVWIGVSILSLFVLFVVEKTQINATNEEKEKKEVDSGVKNLMYALILLLLLGGLTSVGVFSAYIIKENEQNIITAYN